MLLAVIVSIFILSYTGIQIYRKTILSSYPHLIREDVKGEPITEGAGGILWDVSFLFSMYLYWYENAPAKFILLFLGSTFCFTSLGLFEDIYKLNPKIKVALQLAVSVFSVVFYFSLNNIPLSFIQLTGLSLLFLFLINSIRYMEIIHGGASCITFLILITFMMLFKFQNLLSLSYLTLFWLISFFAFLILNIYKHCVAPGNSGAYLFGSVLFLFSMEYYFNMEKAPRPLLSLSLLFIVPAINYIYMKLSYLKFKELVLRNNSDELKFIPFYAENNNKALMIICSVQLFLNIICIGVSQFLK